MYLKSVEERRERNRQAASRHYAAHGSEIRARAKTSEFKAHKNELTRARYLARSQQLDVLKMAMGCLDCGYRGNPKALQFDHVRGSKGFNIASWKHVGLSRLIAELEKCEVRCANCHMIRTFSNGD